MSHSRFADMNCSIARTLDVVGERWTLLVLRDIFTGSSRFDALQAGLGISRKVLAERLARLEEHGVIERVPYQQRPTRYDYVLTEKGNGLGPVLLALIAWGDRWTAGEAGPPALLRHDPCGAVAHAVPACSECGEELHADDLTILPGRDSAAAA